MHYVCARKENTKAANIHTHTQKKSQTTCVKYVKGSTSSTDLFVTKFKHRVKYHMCSKKNLQRQRLHSGHYVRKSPVATSIERRRMLHAMNHTNARLQSSITAKCHKVKASQIAPAAPVESGVLSHLKEGCMQGTTRL